MRITLHEIHVSSFSPSSIFSVFFLLFSLSSHHIFEGENCSFISVLLSNEDSSRSRDVQPSETRTHGGVLCSFFSLTHFSFFLTLFFLSSWDLMYIFVPSIIDRFIEEGKNVHDFYLLLLFLRQTFSSSLLSLSFSLFSSFYPLRFSSYPMKTHFV